MPSEARSPVMLGALIESARPVIVAGCITDFAEQEMVLDAFVTVSESHPDALLVLAPRHPQVTERMRTLREYLKHRGLPAVFRSTISDVPTSAQIACLVLHTGNTLNALHGAVARHMQEVGSFLPIMQSAQRL